MKLDNILKLEEIVEDILKSEQDLKKGSFQSRTPHNPKKDKDLPQAQWALNKNKEDEQSKKSAYQKEREKITNTLTDLRDDTKNVKGMFSRIYSIPSKFKSTIARDTGQVPRSANIYGSHYPIARILSDNKTLVLHTSQYGTDGKTQELMDKIKKQVPDIFPDFKVVELHHPDYKHSAKAMRIKSEKNLADYFKMASENHPDEEYRKHALDAHQHLTKIKKAEYGKPIHSKRIEHERWDRKQNEQKRVEKISNYLQKIGLTTDLDSTEGRKMGATWPSSLGINPEGDPHDQQLIHEAAHAMLTPAGMDLPSYQSMIGKPGFEGKLKASANRKEMQDTHGGGMPEQTAQHLEAGVARRSGIEPFRSPKRGRSPQSQEEKSRRHAKETLGLLDEGIHTFDPFTGEKQYGDSIDALINAKSRGSAELVKPVRDKFTRKVKSNRELSAEELLAASEKDYLGVGSVLKKAVMDLMKTPAPPKVKINPEHGKMIADAYDAMEHNPNHPDVKAAYGALIDETKQQYKGLLDKGFKFSKIKGDQNPYPTSSHMHDDVLNNKHLHWFPTDSGFGSEDSVPKDHPMLQPTEFKDEHGKPMLANDLFRQVHDVNGHVFGGKTKFGATGEHQAFLAHKQIYSPLAQKALASETMGQNSAVNFGKHGEYNRKNPSQTKYADQKAGLLPDSIIHGDWHK